MPNLEYSRLGPEYGKHKYSLRNMVNIFYFLEIRVTLTLIFVHNI